MDTGKFVGLLVFFLVGALVLVAFVPIIQETTSATDTFTNNGYYDMTALDENSEYTLFWDHTKPYQVTVNDDVIEFSGLNLYTAYTIVGSDEFSLRFYNVSDNPRIQLYGGTGWGFASAGYTQGTDFTVTITDGNMTMSNTAETPFEVSNPIPDKCFGIVKDGSLVMKKMNTPAYVMGDTSIIVLCGYTEGTNASVGVYAEGTVNDGLDYTLFRPSTDSETAIFSDEVITASEVNGYVDLKSLSKVEFEVTVTAGTLEPTYSYFIVPKEVTAEKEYHPDSTLATVIDLLPFIAGVGLLMGAVAYFLRRY